MPRTRAGAGYQSGQGAKQEEMTKQDKEPEQEKVTQQPAEHEEAHKTILANVKQVQRTDFSIELKMDKPGQESLTTILYEE